RRKRQRSCPGASAASADCRPDGGSNVGAGVGVNGPVTSSNAIEVGQVRSTNVTTKLYWAGDATTLIVLGGVRRLQPGRIGLVDGIVVGEAVRVSFRDNRIARQEAADDGVVDAGAKVNEAEGREEIAAVPLLGGIVGAAGRGAGGAR